MHDQNSLRALERFNTFLDQLSKGYSMPVTKTEEEVQTIIRQLEQSPLGNNFYTVASTLSVEQAYYIRALDYLPLPKEFFTSDAYIQLIHPAYLVEYLEWATATYAYVAEKSRQRQMEPMRMSFRMDFPIKLKDGKNGKFYWTQIEAYPLQLDKDNNMITHLNAYKVIRPYEETRRRQPLAGEMWDTQFLDEAWTRGLNRQKSLQRPFVPTPAERQILDLLYQNPCLSNKEIASALGKDPNTINQHNKNILAKARESFFPLLFADVRDVAKFLFKNIYDGPQQEPELCKW